MALRDIVKIGSRVIGGVGGFMVGGPLGAAAGYAALGAVGDLAAGEAPEQAVTTAQVSDYDPMSAYSQGKVNRVTTEKSMQSLPSWSDKAVGIADPLVATAGSLAGSFGGGAESALGSVTQRAGLEGVDPVSGSLGGAATLKETMRRKGAGAKWRIGADLSASPVDDISSSLDETQQMIDAVNKNRALSNVPGLSATQSGQILSKNSDYLAYPKNIAGLNAYLNF